MTGASRRQKRTIDLVAELQQFQPLIQPSLDEHEASLVLQLPAGTAMRVEMAPATFRRVLLILLNNAIEWTESIRDPQFRIRVRALGESCELVFSDNGPGIPPDLSEKVFEPMFSTKDGGMGTGLTIARSMVEQDGGTIEVVQDRRRGSGAHLRIELPLRRMRVV